MGDVFQGLFKGPLVRAVMFVRPFSVRRGWYHSLTLVMLDLPAEVWLPGGCASDISARMAFLCLHLAGSFADEGCGRGLCCPLGLTRVVSFGCMEALLMS